MTLSALTLLIGNTANTANLKTERNQTSYSKTEEKEGLGMYKGPFVNLWSMKGLVIQRDQQTKKADKGVL